IEERKGVKKEEQPQALEIELQVDAYIPSSYISDEYQKIEIYKRFRALETEEDNQDLQDELIDRFGDYPEEVELLFAIAQMKQLAKEVQVESIKEKNREIVLLFSEKANEVLELSKLYSLISSVDNRFTIGSVGNRVKIVLRAKGEKDKAVCDLLLAVLQKLTLAKKTVKTSA